MPPHENRREKKLMCKSCTDVWDTYEDASFNIHLSLSPSRPFSLSRGPVSSGCQRVEIKAKQCAFLIRTACGAPLSLASSFLMTLITIIYNGQRPHTRRTTNYILHNVPTRRTFVLTRTRVCIKRESDATNDWQFRSMRFPKMAKFAIVAIVLLASTGSLSQRIIRETPATGEGHLKLFQHNS